MVTLNDDIAGIGTHLAIDTANKVVYWIHFTTDTTYKIYKTTYGGETTQIGVDQTGSLTAVDIGQGNGYFYILNSVTKEISKYDKTNDAIASTISLPTGVTRMIVLAGM